MNNISKSVLVLSSSPRKGGNSDSSLFVKNGYPTPAAATGKQNVENEITCVMQKAGWL
jgi:hypothetical protein